MQLVSMELPVTRVTLVKLVKSVHLELLETVVLLVLSESLVSVESSDLQE